MKNNMKKLIVFCTLLFVAISMKNLTVKASQEAEKLPIEIEISTGGNSNLLKDNDYNSKVKLSSGSVVKIESEALLKGLYLVWDTIPGEWTLKMAGEEYVYGDKNFLHEYVELPKESKSVEIIISGKDTVICDIVALSQGSLPEEIQNWDEPCDKADIIVFSAHADDEQLFFGGLIAHYVGEVKATVQVVYLCQYWTGPYANVQRNHEAINGLWTLGVRNYPVLGEFEDYYSRERGPDKTPALLLSESQYDVEAVLEFVVSQLRRFKPQVAVGHDLINGEYGHGAHMLFAKKLVEAIEVSNDPTFSPETYSLYGGWDVLKTYLHLYDQGKIWLDLRKPIAAFGGKTALETAQEGFKRHISQLYIDVARVDDEYYLSCADFGLYKSLVGPDVKGDDILENITLYKDMPIDLPEEDLDTEEATKEEDSPVAKNSKLTNFIFVMFVFLFLIAIQVVNMKLRKKRRRR